MTVTNVQKDPKALTMTITAELDATVAHAWQLWADPRLLERWWGPPTYPTTVVDHDLVAGGRVTVMTGPEGDKFFGYWDVLATGRAEPPGVQRGFADDSGATNESMPVTNTVVTLTEHDGGRTLMAINSQFPSLEAMSS